eukprot:ANDGO_01744.mRNA.1 Pyruvate
MTAAKKWVYGFGEGSAADKALLGGKGAYLSEMTLMGLRVPPGFTISTETCIAFWNEKSQWPANLESQIETALSDLEKKTGKVLGDADNPLLLSVRSGAKISMPGMMDTVLNLGLNDKVMQRLKNTTRNPRFVNDSFRRFIQMFGDVVLQIEHCKFEHILDATKQRKGVKFDSDLSAEDLAALIQEYLALVKAETGAEFPTDARAQLKMSINAVFNSWNNPRAIAYRNINGIDHNMGTAVNVQAMVFGNWSANSATGVAFTRNPSTGENAYYGEYLANAQGEDVVAGIRTPLGLHDMQKQMPAVHAELCEVFATLEKHFRDMQDVEFTIEEGVLYILQCRSGKRTAQAAVHIAVDMVNEQLISKSEAVLRVEPKQIDNLLHKQIDPKARLAAKAIGKGLPASPGASVGRVVFNAVDAVKLAESKIPSILVRQETSAEDIVGMHVAEGILTARGGMTSHAAVVCRGMNKCCVAGCADFVVDEHRKIATLKGVQIKEGDVLTVDGSTGEVFLGTMPLVSPQVEGAFEVILNWADEFARLKVFANADTPEDATTAVNFGAKGCGLVRTEHMFFDSRRIIHMREVILSETTEERVKALNKLLPFQRDDFLDLFRKFSGHPVIIRLLDPPLHEFLPTEPSAIAAVASELGISNEKLQKKVKELAEFNPLLGTRGCRVGILYPEIIEMQCQGIFEAAVIVLNEGFVPLPHIEIPLAGNVNELLVLKQVIDEVAARNPAFAPIAWKYGAMIETPRAALTADEFASVCSFFSFGTNDLTQTTCGFSRDDAGKFLRRYLEKGIYKADPFQSLDQNGVGKLIRIAVERARSVRPGCDIGVCGEVGGDPDSIEFFHSVGLDNVSVSPYRVPVARLAAAQAALRASSSSAKK